MSENKEVVKQDPIMNLLQRYKSSIAGVLPQHLTPERMINIAHKAIYRSPKLTQCTPLSLINSIIEVSKLGLEVGRTAHLVPFKDQATVIIDYKGMIELAHRSVKVASLPMKAVYENDFFEYAEGTTRYIKHTPAKEKRGKIIAAYAIVNFKGGGFDFEVVLPEDIAIIKKRSAGARKSDSPWNTDDEPMMWCKSAMRRIAKRIPQCPELQKAAYLDELAEAGIKQGIDHIADTIDADFSEVPKPEQVVDAEKVKCDINKKLAGLKESKQTEEEKAKPGIHCPETEDIIPVMKCTTNCDINDKCEAYKAYLEAKE